MPPTSTSPQDTVQYLTRLLTALVKRAGGELRVPRKLLRQLGDESNRQVLLEDTDSKRDEIVLRFGSKHSAIYPVEPEVAPSPANLSRTASQQPLQPQSSQPATSQQRSHAPLTDEQLARVERKLRQIRTAREIVNPPAR